MHVVNDKLDDELDTANYHCGIKLSGDEISNRRSREGCENAPGKGLEQTS